MNLVARPREITEVTRHFISTVIEGRLVPLQEIPSPAWVEIVEEDDGYYLFRCDEAGVSLADSWFPCLEEAKRQAWFEYRIEEGDWIALASTGSVPRPASSGKG